MRRRPTTVAAFAVVVFAVGQVLALAHDAATRHVVCAEHGEQIELGEAGGTAVDCDHSHLSSSDAKSGEHRDCDIERLLQTSTQTSHAPSAHVLTAVVATVEPPAPIAIAVLADIISLAPKTSPPALS